MQISSDKISAIANIWGRQSTTKSEEFVQKGDSTSEAYTLDLSEAAQKYMSSSQALLARAQGKELTKAALPDGLQQSIDHMQDRLNRTLLSHNINTAQDISFEFDKSGLLKVTSEHPDKEKIERILNEDKEFINEARRTLQDSSEYASGEVQKKYVELLEDDDKDDEDKEKIKNEYERQSDLQMRAAKAQEQVAAASNSFMLGGGALTMSSIATAHSIIL
ncbi:MAG: hypothetical protein IJ479_00480 [Alphaproteobacteria bacterium]|nr:hypothetical protein [Alphaproteobacteria bacterium]